MPITLKPSVLNQWRESVSGLSATGVDSADPQTPEDVLAWAIQNDVAKSDLLRGLAQSLGVDWSDSLDGFCAAPEFIAGYPIILAREKLVLAGQEVDGAVQLALGSLESLGQLDHIRRFLGRSIRPFFTDPDRLLALINGAYENRASETHSTIEQLDRDEALAQLRSSAGGDDLLETSGRSPVIKLVFSIFFDAIRARASDIHIQPYADHLQIRFRIDGILFDQFQVPKENQEEVISRVKVIGKMNIAEKRLPQDGRATVSVGDRVVDLRIASLPTSYGERVVIRLLDKSARLYTLGELGMSEESLARFRKLIHLEHGLILVTGPTGGGKSTTLYAALQELDVTDKNVVTLEDPIEYQLQGISQTQISEKKGMTFASALRHVLRQDPDVVMIGEIRDRETAEMAIQSALTGHMVYSTLHTNDAPSAITRLLDLGIEPYLVSSSVVAVLAQRLVRRICGHCIEPIERGQTRFSELGAVVQGDPDSVLYRGIGCEACRNTGYSGRLGVFELMVVDEPVRSLIQRRQDASKIRETAVKSGMRLLRDDGIAKANRRLTTIDEVLRVSMDAAD